MSVAHTSLEARHKIRQDEIIQAARVCFRKSGFHGASMANIATESGLSVGQIYRYFSNKDAIIEEMIRRIIDYRITEIERKAQAGNMPEIVPHILAWRLTLSEDDDALMLEMSAEATRNPQVATMLMVAEEKMFSSACAQLKRDYPHLPEERIRSGFEVMSVLMEGTIYRRLTPQTVQPEHLERIYRKIIHQLFIAENDFTRE
ncbi:TetR/AcrR family transcriptional regulator [Klebsiella aerogenes]|uniref:TetR/AcrR family transcriptional regulator n=1 Tax=Klebsiella aerogenes TaxID=548 RepID=UPI00244A20A3|nr:helix-turn-helix domain containing protein [Klebsiella aerogenes]MDH1612442.1 TetR/AcrR family transcriptional regulator [Klebsiella aerogenes]